MSMCHWRGGRGQRGFLRAAVSPPTLWLALAAGVPLSPALVLSADVTRAKEREASQLLRSPQDQPRLSHASTSRPPVAGGPPSQHGREREQALRAGSSSRARSSRPRCLLLECEAFPSHSDVKGQSGQDAETKARGDEQRSSQKMTHTTFKFKHFFVYILKILFPVNEISLQYSYCNYV